MGAFCNTRRDFYLEKTVNMKMSFSHAAYQTSQLKRFSNLDITKERWQKKKKKYCSQFHCLFHPNESNRFFFETMS